MDRQSRSERALRLNMFIGDPFPFHEGPLRETRDYNGVFIEDLLHVAADRLREHNETEFRCRENSLAITHIEEALHWLNARTMRREEAGVEGRLETMEGEG